MTLEKRIKTLESELQKTKGQKIIVYYTMGTDKVTEDWENEIFSDSHIITDSAEELENIRNKVVEAGFTPVVLKVQYEKSNEVDHEGKN